jgi:hypothetical protein
MCLHKLTVHRHQQIYRPINRLASKMVFVGFAGALFLAESPIK